MSSVEKVGTTVRVDRREGYATRPPMRGRATDLVLGIVFIPQQKRTKIQFS